MRSALGPRRLCEERNVTVMSTVSGCDVTTVQQHYTGSTSTPPRVARLRKISQIYVSIVRLDQSIMFVSEISTVARRHCSICQVNSSRSAQYPCQASKLNLWNRSLPSAFVPMSLGFTSVLTDDIVKSFRNTKS